MSKPWTVDQVVTLYSNKVNDYNRLTDDYNELLEWARQAYADLYAIYEANGMNEQLGMLDDAPAEVKGD